MPRRKTGLVEDLLEITAALPWWMGVTLAAIVYGVLHQYASLEMSANNIPGQIGHRVVEQIGRTFAYYGQYVLPLLFLFGALVSFLKRRKRMGLIRAVGNGRSDDVIRDISWRDFELLVGEAFRMRGFSVIETGGGGADGGIDLVLKKDSELFLVQCKQWRAYKVSVNVVRELLGVMISRRATGGFVVTSGVFTAEAHSFAKGQNIELIDGSKLAIMIEKARNVASISASTEDSACRSFTEIPAMSIPTPICPQCGDTMVKRVAKKGVHVGNVFWGCTGFPKCRGVRSVD
ncbi:restriction endonuclease [Nitrosomonas supralitoralis]|uniref:Restriction system protein n=1 Tax=Nitrosomonas supralitoralis TaxID=2116706 RepID=A0A2P7NSW1_9PROT|nr:restriction endonuclease [Nitrosomonas supralitoralis]PSJ16556.1 hypothetical protein C7H79_12915 [Nitrosomonas supralitoralis]